MSNAIRLSEQELIDGLATLTTWRREDQVLTATFRMATFPVAIELVDRVAVSAEAANHHPDIDIRWRSVRFRLTTHDAGGLTAEDLDLARRIDAHAAALGWTQS